MYSPRIVHFCSAIDSPHRRSHSLLSLSAPEGRRGPLASGPRRPLRFVEDALVEVADDHAGQPLIVDEEALADRIGILLGDFERLFEDLVRGHPAIDEALDIADPVLDDLALLFEVRLGAGVAMTGDDGLDVERLDALQQIGRAHV